MPIIARGTELKTIAEIVPGAIQGGDTTAVARTAGGGSVVVPDVDYGIIRLTALDGFTRNHSGNPITGYDLGGVDPVFSNIIAYLYPEAAGDDNDIQWEVPVPQDMDLTDPQITVICHFLIPDPPYTPAPIPGGLPIGCENAFITFQGGEYVAAIFTVDVSGNIIMDGTGNPVMVPC